MLVWVYQLYVNGRANKKNVLFDIDTHFLCFFFSLHIMHIWHMLLAESEVLTIQEKKYLGCHHESTNSCWRVWNKVEAFDPQCTKAAGWIRQQTHDTASGLSLKHALLSWNNLCCVFWHFTGFSLPSHFLVTVFPWHCARSSITPPPPFFFPFLSLSLNCFNFKL